MAGQLKLRFVPISLMVALACLTSGYAHATCAVDTTSPSTSSGTTAIGTTWSWQVDTAPTTTTLVSQAGFNRSTTTNCELVQINIPIPAARNVHEVHGQISFADWSGGSTCMDGSIIGQVRDQSENVIASFKIQQFGPSSITVPVTGTFTTPLPVTALQIQYFADECGAVTWSWSLVMS